MKVKELIEKLSTMPQNAEVWMQYYPEDRSIVRNCGSFEWQGVTRVQIDNYKE